MALIKCSECGKEFSDKAPACPNCGCPIEEIKQVGEDAKKDVETVTEEQDGDKIAECPTVTEKETDKTENKKSGNTIKIVAGIVVAAIVVGVGGYFATANTRDYSKAQALMEEKNLEDAKIAFAELGDYKDSATMVLECDYQLANKALKACSYEKAIDIFQSLGEYEDAAELAKEAQYQFAMNNYENELFEDALEKLNKIADYKDAKTMISKCEYELTVDGKFMRALSKGLMARWDKNKEYENEGENPDHYYEFCQLELDQVEGFYDQKFDSEELEKDAKQYIDYLKKAQKATKQYTVNYSLYSDTWSEVYANRTMLLQKMVSEYGLVVDGKYQDTLDGLMDDASAAAENKAVKESIIKMCEDFEISEKSDEWGYKTYKIKAKNTTNLTFEYFYVDINVLDSKGNIISDGSSDSADNWKPNQQATLDLYIYNDEVNVMKNEIEYIPHYSSGSYYD